MSRSVGSLLIAPAFGAALVLAASPVLGQPAPPAKPWRPPERVVMRLDFNGVPGCSDPEPFVLTLTPRVRGWDPLSSDGRWQLVVTIKRQAAGFSGSAELHDPKGDVVWTRSFPPKASCFILLDRLSLATAFRIDPLDPLPPTPTPAPPAAPEPTKLPAPAEAPPPQRPPPPELPPAEPPPAPTKPLPEAVPRSAPTEAKTPLTFRLGAGLWADLISPDRGSLGLTLDAGIRRGWFSAAVEGRGDPPLGATSVSINGSAVIMRFARITGALLLCGHYNVLVGCVKGQAGRILFPGTVPPEPAQVYGAAGVRIGLEYPAVPPWFLLRLDAEALAPINLASYEVRGQSVFQVSGWNAGLGLGALFALGKQ